jgi:hypothetical protein
LRAFRAAATSPSESSAKLAAQRARSSATPSGGVADAALSAQSSCAAHTASDESSAAPSQPRMLRASPARLPPHWRCVWSPSQVRTLPAEACRESAQLVALAAQIAALSQLRHPHVLAVLGGSTVPPHCCLIMPRAEHGSVGVL